MRVTSSRRAIGAVATAMAVLVAGCGTGDADETVATVTEVVTAPPTTQTTQTSGPSSTVQKPASELASSFDGLGLAQPVGLVVAPVGGGAPMQFGDQSPLVAWSTIKVPLALAAERQNGPSQSESAAIIDSDNAAAEALWTSLGSNEDAAAAVTRVLREAGDENTTVPTTRLRPGFTVFGQTVWPLVDAATFTANLPCLPDSGHLVSLMEQVSGNQQWGIEVIPHRTTAVKGGWGPNLDGGYIVRQIGLVTLRNGRQAAVAMSTYAPGASMDSGIAALNQVGSWVGRHLVKLPSGRCG